MQGIFKTVFLPVIPLLMGLNLFAQKAVPMSDSMARAIVRHNADSLINGSWFEEAAAYQKGDSTAIRKIDILRKPKTIRLYAGSLMAYAPFRTEVVDSLLQGITKGLTEPYSKYQVELYAGKDNIRDLVPNYHRKGKKSMDQRRSPGSLKRKDPPLVTQLSRPWLENSSLHNINVALWHSHGWYYEPKLKRWEWQRARIFQTVEDIYPLAYTLPFLAPMLENAGAGVFLPRERDWQSHEVIVDNDGSSGNSLYAAGDHLEESERGTGFALGTPPYVDENPFRLGTYHSMPADRKASEMIQWIPEIPEAGDYAVYISYESSKDNANDAFYRVYHRGGVSEFRVNQQMGGATWIYLGKFSFAKGVNPDEGKVVLNNQGSKRGSKITADAVKFGGGMGNISRNGLTGKRPRYQEGARYYLQYAGMPDSLVWKLNENNDYNDDYQSRGEWVNYLMGAPSGPLVNRKAKGLSIPVDLSFAFHTDAGITDNDTVVGTLGIYSSNRDSGKFPAGLSRMSSRDLTDLIQSQIVDDLRHMYDPAWTRRGMWDKGYSEAFRPNVPSMLLELFSHQNFLDMRFGQEPMFRFHVSRSIYKGMLRFLSAQYGLPYVVQPLPVDHLRTEILEDGRIKLSWKPVVDPLEPTAKPESYLVYTRKSEGAFDQGTPVESPEYILEEVTPDIIYSFKVTALNRGGEGFPSEILAACVSSDSKGQLAIVSAFDRVSGPAWFNDSEYAGFMNMVDQGVPWGVDLHTVGDQFDYVKASPWLDDDSPGHGASYANLEQHIIPGNTFDFSYMHGASIQNAGYSFVSISDEVLMEDSLDLSAYSMLDYLAGEERTTRMPKNDTVLHYRVWPEAMLGVLENYLQNGGSLLVSGAHIASDMHENQQDSIVGKLLKFKWRTSNASRVGEFYSMDPDFASHTRQYTFNTGFDPVLYTVEGADALEPFDSEAITLFRYSENNMSAGVAYRGDYGVVSMGFPFETIISRDMRDEIMLKTINYLLQNSENDQD